VKQECNGGKKCRQKGILCGPNNILLAVSRELGIWSFHQAVPEKLGGWSLLPVAIGKQRKLVLPMNVILQDI
jgi:hypothetical protein